MDPHSARLHVLPHDVQFALTVIGLSSDAAPMSDPGPWWEARFYVAIDVDQRYQMKTSYNESARHLEWNETFHCHMQMSSDVSFSVYREQVCCGTVVLKLFEVITLHDSRSVSLPIISGGIVGNDIPASLSLLVGVSVNHPLIAVINSNAGQPHDPSHFQTIASRLLASCKKSVNSVDLQFAVDYSTLSLKYIPVDHPARPPLLTTLAECLHLRFERNGASNDLADSIAYCNEALQTFPSGNLNRCGALDCLASALKSRYQMGGELEDLSRAIECSKSCLDLQKQHRMNGIFTLNNLGSCMWLRFTKSGDMAELESSIAYLLEALAISPPDHPDRSASLNNLGIGMFERYNQLGGVGDLEAAIRYGMQSIELRPIGHPLRSLSLNNMALMFWTKFQLSGRIEDLDLAINYHNDALHLRPPGHPRRSSSLNNIGIALRVRFQRNGDMEDLESAIRFHREALSLRPIGHPERDKSLNNLATAIEDRYVACRDITDLQSAIQLNSEALLLRSPGHPERFKSLNNLSVALRARFEAFGVMDDIDLAIDYQTEVLSGFAPTHPYRGDALNELANMLMVHPRARDDLHYLDLAFEYLNTAESILPQDHPFLCFTYRNLASACIKQFSFTEDITQQEEAFNYYKRAASMQTAGPLSNLIACFEWISSARNFNHPSLLDAYRTALTLLDRHVMVTPELVSRHRAHMIFVPPTLAVDAAACAIESGELQVAVELLEQGRALLWTQLTRFRTSLDSLRVMDTRGQMLAEKFERLSRSLERGSLSLKEETDSADTAESQAQLYRGLSREWDDTVEEIRSIHGFELFLQPMPFTELQEAAEDGPVIILNISQYRSDAIIVTKDGPPRLLPLGITLEEVTNLSSDFIDALHRTPTQQRFAGEKEDKTEATIATEKNREGGRERDRGKNREKNRERRLRSVLRKLWIFIVCPVFQVLQELVAGEARIWWCPTSTAVSLPFHAAGLFCRGDDGIHCDFISSYTPTLSTLIRSRDQQPVSPTLPALLSIGQGQPYDGSGQEELPSVDKELRLIESLSPPSIQFKSIYGDNGTCDAVLQGIRDHNWVHIACHGSQDISNPYNSSLYMRDNALTLLDIIKARLTCPEFAFLSACHTAVGDQETPDEVIHLAAGMQFSGFRSVIGTVGMVDDSTVLHLVKEFYKNMFGGEIHYTNAARSLHQANRALMKKGLPLDQRIVFIHIGA